jgi:hypothetical protein
MEESNLKSVLDKSKSYKHGKYNYYHKIEYTPMVDRMVKILEILLDSTGGVIVGGENNNTGDYIDVSKLSWTLREFELIDLLISQVSCTDLLFFVFLLCCFLSLFFSLFSL